MTMRRIAWVGLVAAMALAGLAGPGRAQGGGKKAITFGDMIKLHRVGTPAISADGKWVVYVIMTPDMEANRNASNLWLVATDGGSEPVQLTQSGKDMGPVWSPDGKMIAFLSSRDGESQVFILPLGGGEAHAWTHVSGGVDIVKWSPDGKTIAFTSAVYADCKDDECNKKQDEEKAKSKVKAHVAERLLYRHWMHWSEGKRRHLFVVAAPANAAQTEAGAAPKDLTASADYDVPPDERGGPEDINFSPDGTEICFTAVTDKMEAISTNADLFLVPVAGGAEPKRITKTTGFDGNPVYSPDGKWIAYHSQLTAGYEADRWRLMMYERSSGTISAAAETFDRSVSELAWSGDSKTIYFVAENETLQPVYAMDARIGAVPKKIVDLFNLSLTVSGDGKTLAFERTSLNMPAELFVAQVGAGGEPKQITHHNDAILANVEMNPPETFSFEGAEAARVQAMVLRPPNFDPAKKYPLLVLLHGGPQTMWGNSWGYRWNAQVFSAAGYICLMINRRGSTGYGQKFADEITNDWGGKAYVDVMKGVDAALVKYKYIDGTRMAAAGGSYGGYLADWIATHTGRFKAIISHAGVYDKAAMYATEELWFEEHDMGGTPWGNPESYRKWAPATYAGELGRYKTPTLVVAGELDYRVPYTQSLEFFNALQRQGVPSKLVVFPDEGHWVLKPANAEFWYKTFLGWLGEHLR
jgi:dipeptidyl aminopeptidase/acylaminoacyl peptidase